ncbi:MAG: LysM peptidoglycan-binding domain-containing protein [Chloroflexota bacterium]
MKNHISMLRMLIILGLAIILGVGTPATSLVAATLSAPLAVQDSVPVSNHAQYHYVRHGETLSQIALNYGTSVRVLMRENNIHSPNHIYVGQKLLVPNASSYGHKHGAAQAHRTTECRVHHTVVHGQTLSMIAVYYGVSQHQLAVANQIADYNHIYTGQRLCIPGVAHMPPPKPTRMRPPKPTPVPPPPTATPAQQQSQTKYGHYTIRAGDTLQSIAHAHTIPLNDLMRINYIVDPYYIHVGQVLHIPAYGAHLYLNHVHTYDYDHGHTHGSTHGHHPAPMPTATPMPTKSPAAQPTPTRTLHLGYWIGHYYNNQTFSGQPTVVRTDTRLDFDWGTGSPDPRIPADKFTVYWTRDEHFTGGYYRFFATVDDGIRVYINDQLVIDSWQIQTASDYYGDVYLSDEGYYSIRVEYFEFSGLSEVQVHWGKL